MATQTSKPLLISFILVLVAYLFDIIGFSTTYHTVIDGTSFDVHGGLWKQCVTVNDVTTCSDISDSVADEDWFRSCRALSIIALICFLAGAICTGLKLFALKENKALLIAAICTILTAAICILTSDILLTQNIDDFSVNGVDAVYGWGFALTLVGMGIAVIVVVIMIVDLVKGGGNAKVNSNDEEK
ncbi:uncharacterized protein LOC134695240 [Mytilus trossulus]|uniref:uncharacterized protein LOC134695240 n=1 Tax=Mytilus trossulus TaxID=6551 RepID=UPI00300791D7